MILDKFFLRIFNRKHHSVWVAVLGQNQSGKTDFALLLLEIIYRLGLGDAFVSNIPDLDAPFKIEFIEDFVTLKKFCIMLNPNPKPSTLKHIFFLADELGNWAAQDRPWENTELIREMQTVRKYGLSAVGTGITRIDKRILNEMYFHGYFMKSKMNQKKATYYDWTTRTRKVLNNIPRTSIKFDTFHPARFYMQPQTTESKTIPLSHQHELVKKYMESGSWKKADVHPQEGKRAQMAVNEYHFRHCVPHLHEESQDKPNVESSSTD